MLIGGRRGGRVRDQTAESDKPRRARRTNNAPPRHGRAKLSQHTGQYVARVRTGFFQDAVPACCADCAAHRRPADDSRYAKLRELHVTLREFAR